MSVETAYLKACDELLQLKAVIWQKEKKLRPIHSFSVLEVGFSFPTRSSSFCSTTKGENWLNFLRTTAGYLADKEE